MQTTANSAQDALQFVATLSIIPSLTNPRQTFKGMDELTASIRQHGVMQPLLLRPLTNDMLAERLSTGPGEQPSITEFSQIEYELVCGERRLRAAIEANKQSVPALIRHLSDAEAREIQLIENLQREDVSEIEEAEGLQALMTEHGYSADQIAERINQSKAYVYARLKLLDLCPEARKATLDEKISASVALLVARIPVPSLQLEALKAVSFDVATAEPMSYRKAKQFVSDRYTIDMSRARFDIADAKLVPLAGDCTTCAKRTGYNRDLFADVAADVCTDTGCFKAKETAHSNRDREAMAQRGHAVLSHEDSKALLHYPAATSARADSGLVSLDALAIEADSKSTYRELIDATQEKLTILENAHGQLIECITTTALAEALIRAGITQGKVQPTSAAGQGSEEEQDEEQDTAQEPDHHRNQLDDPKNDAWRAQQMITAQQARANANAYQLRHAIRDVLAGKIGKQLKQGAGLGIADIAFIALALSVRYMDLGDATEVNELARLLDEPEIDEQFCDQEVYANRMDEIATTIQHTTDPATLAHILMHIAISEAAHLPDIDSSLRDTATRWGIDLATLHLEATGEPLPTPEPVAADSAPTAEPAAQAQVTQAAEGKAQDSWPFAAPEDKPEEQAAKQPAPPEQAAPAPKPKKATAAKSSKAKPKGKIKAASAASKPKAKTTKSSGSAAGGKAKTATGATAIAYRHPDSGQTWTGRGKQPAWVAQHLAAGGTLDDIRVGS